VRNVRCNLGGIRPTSTNSPLDPRVAQTYIRALEVADEDLLKVIPTIDDVYWQMIQPNPGGIS
jgi:hypothetical protein